MGAQRPNILWIVTTQWRAQATGYEGDPNARTPCLDAFAAQATCYAQAVTPHPFGPFARAALLTGVPSPQNGVRDYFDPLPRTARTVAHALGESGYATAFFGKWHLHERDRSAPLVGEAHAKIVVPPDARGGIGWWEGFESGFLLNDPWLHGSALPTPKQFHGYQSDVVCARAGEWLQRPGPWFCVVSLDPPHPPYDAPSGDVAPRSPAARTLAGNVPIGGEIEMRARRELAGYYAHIEATDRAIGRLLANVAFEPTAVVITSVHGDMHGAHGLFRKGWPHEESIRVPLLVRLPPDRRRSLDSGVRRSELVSLPDLPRWARSWASGVELQIPNPKLETEIQRISMPSVVGLPDQCDRMWRGVRTRTRKLILEADGSPWLFFDLEQDPLELRNLAADPARAAEIDRWRQLV